MPSLTNSKHERFAQEIAKGVSQQQAYVIAGFKAHLSNPSKLAKDSRIVARIAELHSDRIANDAAATEKAVEALSIDKQWVMSRLMKNADTALGSIFVKGPVLCKDGGATIVRELEYMDRDPAAANKALELLGKELGMFIDRSENTNIDHVISDKPVDRDGDGFIAKHGGASTH